MSREPSALQNDALVQPELQRLRDELGGVEADFARAGEAFDRDTQRKQSLMARAEELEVARHGRTKALQEGKEVLQKASVEPERIRKQAESVQKACDNLASEIERVKEKIASCETEIERQIAKRSEAEEVRTNLQHKLELHRDTIAHRQRDVEAVTKNVEIERARHHALVTTRLELEMQRKATDENLRHEVDSLSLSKKEHEMLNRRLRKKKQIANGAAEVLPTLTAQKVDNEHLLRSHVEENKLGKATIESSRQEVDLSIARFLRQEGVERSKREALEALLRDVAGMEDEIAKWSTEERRQNKLIAVLSAQREMKAREATRAQAAEKETREAVKVKELVIVDLSKKCNEVSNRLKEFSALYDVVKNERNKYVNLIQASSQALAEMKEKIKILLNEVEILRNESLAKDKALAKERAQHLASQASRDGLRLELNRSQGEYRKKQEIVEQQIVEIDKLNSIINGLERDMLRLKAQYEAAVEARNLTGVSLIDRNDELCILYEKANLQEQTLKAGELAVRQKEEDIRMLKLQLVELQRQVMVTRKQLPRMPALAHAVVRLQAELKGERRATEALCRELESPSNSGRWRTLPGEDPDREQLLAKTAVLDERLNAKKEALLEKELILEEVTSLTTKLRSRANDGRAGTLDLARKVNEFQSKIRDATRRMMATVSELSMYQATAMKLQQHKRVAEAHLEEAKWRVAHGEAPTDEAAREAQRLAIAAAEGGEGVPEAAGGAGGMPAPHSIVRTTAEPRPNAYIPDASGLGIPKPYGALAPFKPTQPGATMRHIRPPSPPKIFI